MALAQCANRAFKPNTFVHLARLLSETTGPATRDGVAVTALHLHKKEKVLEVTFSSGEVKRFSAELLRVCSPSAENCSTGGNVKVPAGRRYVGIMGLEPVGNYAVRITFDDLHSTGLFTWDFLHDLGRHKFSRAKQYITSLRQQGLSRDPRAAKPRASSSSSSSSGGNSSDAGGSGGGCGSSSTGVLG